MKAIVAGAKAFRHLELERSVGRKTAGVFVESELENHIWPRRILRGFHYVIEKARDMRYEGELVGWVGLNGVGANVRCQPFDGRLSHRSIIAYGMYPYMTGLIIGGQQILTLAVGTQKS